MAIKVGDTLPFDIKLKEMGEKGPQDVSVGDLFKGKKVVLFAVPGAFTPTCSMKHLPGFVREGGGHQGEGRRRDRLHVGQRCLRDGRLGRQPEGARQGADGGGRQR